MIVITGSFGGINSKVLSRSQGDLALLLLTIIRLGWGLLRINECIFCSAAKTEICALSNRFFGKMVIFSISGLFLDYLIDISEARNLKGVLIPVKYFPFWVFFLEFCDDLLGSYFNWVRKLKINIFGTNKFWKQSLDSLCIFEIKRLVEKGFLYLFVRWSFLYHGVYLNIWISNIR